MKPVERAAYIISQSICALIEAMGMMAENQWREQRGESTAYGDEAFSGLLDRYELRSKDVFHFLQEH